MKSRLRSKFGDAEYARAVEEGGNRRLAEAGLAKRAERVKGLHIQPLAPADRARAADISVDHPLVLANYRTTHGIALRQAKGQANTEDLRQAMINSRTGQTWRQLPPM